MKRPWLALIPILALVLGACSAARATVSPSMAPAPQAAEEGRGFTSSAGEAAPDYQAQLPTERLVIKNADIEIIVADPEAAMDHISRMAEELGGYVVAANLSQRVLASGEEVPYASVKIRVPAPRLDEALERIAAESDRQPRHKTIDSQDVTKDYVDLQSRLRNLEATEAKLTEFLDKARNTEDTLNVFSQLKQVREEIEVTKGQIQYYEQSAALSAVSVQLTANAAVQPLKIGKWEPAGVAKDAVLALANALRFFVNAAIWTVIFIIPVLVILLAPPGVILWAILRWRARRRTAKKPEPQPQA
jgi:hypothetical protein